MTIRLFNKCIVLLTLVVLACVATGESVAFTGGSKSHAAKPELIKLELFFEAGCPECAALRREVLPEIDAAFGNEYRLIEYETTVLTNYLRLVTYQEKLGVEGNPNIYMVLDHVEAFSGLQAIRTKLADRMRMRIENRHVKTSDDLHFDDQVAWGLIQNRFHAFTIGGIMTAGLIDGVNPCAISALVFMISMLSVSGLRAAKVLWVGSIFVATVFITYFLLGFGAFRLLGLASDIGLRWRSGIEAGMILVLLLFAVVSFRDAWRFWRTADPECVKLQLSSGMKSQIRRVTRKGLKMQFLVPGVIMIGVIVTLVESVCTGQVYIPTLVWMVRAGYTGPRGIVMIALYNVMHVAPLAVVFLLVWRGVGTPTLIKWSRKNVAPSKCLLGVFFIAMAMLIIFVQ